MRSENLILLLMAFMGILMAGLAAVGAIRDKRGTLERLTPNVCVLFGSVLVGSLLGEIVISWASERGSLANRLAPIAMVFVLPPLFRFANLQRVWLIQAWCFAGIIYILLCCTPLARYNTSLVCNLLLATNGGLLVAAGWSSTRRAQVLGVFILVAVVGMRYSGFRHWQEVKRSYRQPL